MNRILSVLVMVSASAFASVDTGLIALIPANTKVVGGMDVTQARASQFGQYLMAKSQANDPHFEQFMTQTGFDPRRDLQSILVTSPTDGGKSSSFAILARGTFDQSKITNLAISKGATTTTYQGITLLLNTDKAKQQIAVAFPDTGIAVMGDLASVQSVIQNLTTPALLDVNLTNMIDATAPGSDAWFVSTVGGSMIGREFSSQTGGQGNGQMQALQSIHAASGGVKFGANVAVTFDASTRSSQDAASLADVFRFMASMVQMQRQKDPKAGILASALDNMQLSTSDSNVHVGLSIPEQNLEQIAAAHSSAGKQ